MKFIEITAAVLLCVAAVLITAPTAYAASGSSAYFIDNADIFSESEETEFYFLLKGVAEESGLNVAVLTSDDVGSDKSDYGVVDYADCYYENLFGADTDGILYLINEDTKIDYLSTSGEGIRIFDDSREEMMLDGLYYKVVEGDYAGAVRYFADNVSYYASLGAENDVVVYNDEYWTENEPPMVGYLSTLFVAFIGGGFIFVVIAAFIIWIVRKRIKREYVKENKVSARKYIADNSLVFTESDTKFVREYSIRVNTSSSSGRSGGGGRHRSGSHRSSRGGRHGGRGRHR